MRTARPIQTKSPIVARIPPYPTVRCAAKRAVGGPMDLREGAAVSAIGTGGTLAAIWIGLLATGHDVVSGTGVFPFTDHLVPGGLPLRGPPPRGRGRLPARGRRAPARRGRGPPGFPRRLGPIRVLRALERRVLPRPGGGRPRGLLRRPGGPGRVVPWRRD